MSLANLAASSDLSTRGADNTNTDLVDEMLAVASSTVRGAAASPILETDSTVTLVAWGGQWLQLPGNPVTSISSVTLNGTAVTGWTLDAGTLWRAAGWGSESAPATVVVELTHGFSEVPPEIRNLVCDLAIAGLLAASEGARDVRKVAERIDDYSVTFAQGADAVASIMELPSATRSMLRNRFGGGASLVVTR